MLKWGTMRIPTLLRTVSTLAAAGLLSGPWLLSPAAADPTTQTLPTPPNFGQEGQPPAPSPGPPATAPASPPVVQVGNPADDRGFLYERRRIKRTPPLDLAAGL